LQQSHAPTERANSRYFGVLCANFAIERETCRVRDPRFASCFASSADQRECR